MKKRCAFTLVELLCVVAIIAILAAIAVPNFLEAQVRTKMARTHSDMAVVVASLRCYYADQNAYPPNNPELRDFLRACAAVEKATGETVPTPTTATVSWTRDDPGHDDRPNNPRFFAWKSSAYYPILNSSGYDLAVLTTPVAYLSRELVRDLFHAELMDPEAPDATKPFPLGYINLPDLYAEGVFELPEHGRKKRFILFSYGPDADWQKPDFTNPVKGPFIPYDPTNGVVTRGDVYHFGDWSRQLDPKDLPKDKDEG